MDVTDTDPAGPVFTRGERVAGIAGMVVAFSIGLICLDMASGGALSARASRGKATGTDDDGGCGCG